MGSGPRLAQVYFDEKRNGISVRGSAELSPGGASSELRRSLFLTKRGMGRLSGRPGAGQKGGRRLLGGEFLCLRRRTAVRSDRTCEGVPVPLDGSAYTRSREGADEENSRLQSARMQIVPKEEGSLICCAVCI